MCRKKEEQLLNLGRWLEVTISSFFRIFRRTLASIPEDVKTKPTAKDMELKLIHSKRDIEEPKVTIKAQKI